VLERLHLVLNAAMDPGGMHQALEADECFLVILKCLKAETHLPVGEHDQEVVLIFIPDVFKPFEGLDCLR
jgi:hypothetical protein